MRTNLNCKNCK